ncbi:ribonuclease II [Leifsonia sp. Root4]|uniref:RNB domain-containing ribonuclease n=1 Tax=Leifsonia sp. Root4 TaxID=1736525 RepID=UPI0006FF731F|nr:RNB domain-containing ribonuclease [Leifsonia sp. Root4]KQW07544.1 ribonuclease II [Leifsonia sp. Root4]
MPTRRPHVTASAAQTELAATLAELRISLELPGDFPEDAVAEAVRAAAHLELPQHDLTDVEFVTIDPPTATDLDQAMHIEALQGPAGGFRVRYAIADVPALVSPGGAVDREARVRGQTLYAADGRIPLHPPAIGDGAGSLLPDALRSAYVWDFTLAADAAVRSATVQRARIRSRARLSYAEAQRSIDDGTASGPLALLKPVGLARIELERRRGGASLNSPDEEIVLGPDGYTLRRREPLPVEDWNAQLSLMTGMAAAGIMIAGGVGILRTMPTPSEDEFASFRRQTIALGLPWPETQPYGEYLRALDRQNPAALAVLQAATSLFRGAGYVAFDTAAGLPAPRDTIQSAIAAPYAHTTAPLRRLVDRWSLVICAALCAGDAVPEWARHGLTELPSIMAASARRASELDAASVNRVEAALLSDDVGRRFEATVLSLRGESARVQLASPAVTAECHAPRHPSPGSRVSVLLLAADIASGSVRFEVVEQPAR